MLCLPLAKVLDQYIPKNTCIDLLSIDVEGLDFDVLESNDWGKYRPNVITIEGHGFKPSLPNDYKIYEFLISKNYYLYAFTGLSLIFIHKDFKN